MERLSGLDAFFLYLETPTQPLNVCCVLELDTSTMPRGYSYSRLRAALAKRVRAMPEFRMKLADTQLNLDHPVWVDDEDFQLRRHVHRVGAPAPGGRREVAEVCGYIAGLPLDRDRPMWEMWVIEGGARSGAVTVMLKIHHSVVDGVAGANLLVHLCSLEPDAPVPAPTAQGAGGGSPLQIALGGLKEYALRPLRLSTVVPATLLTLAQTALRAREGRTMAAPFATPRTVFNAGLSAQRNIAYTQLDMRDIKRVKDRFGVTINDVVVALCAGVLRRFLLKRGELPAVPLVAAVPVSVHDKSHRPGRNHTTWMFCRLDSQISDPAERIRTAASGNAAAKDHTAAIGPDLLHDWTQFGGPAVFGAVRKILPRIPISSPAYNLILSSVPGPQTELYFLGCRIDAMYPIGPLLASAGLNITVMSLHGELGVGVISCPDLLPDLWGIADEFPEALKELLECGDEQADREVAPDQDP